MSSFDWTYREETIGSSWRHEEKKIVGLFRRRGTTKSNLMRTRPKVILIRPPALRPIKSPAAPTCPPIGLAYVAASLMEAGCDVEVIDALGEAPKQYYPTRDLRFVVQGLSNRQIIERTVEDAEILGFSCMYSYEWPNVRQLISDLRNHLPQALFVLGGEHATAMAEFCLQDCPALDVCVVGEGEETMAEIVKFNRNDLPRINGIVFRNGLSLRRTDARKRIRKVDDIPKPAWDLFPIENYLVYGYGRGVNRGRNMPLLTSRGCPYRCTFCSNEQMWGTSWIPRSPSLVFAEMKEYIEKYNVNNFDFYDLTTVVNRHWIIKFCSLIIESGYKFTWQLASGTRSEAIDREVSELLYKSGCANISFAPESGSRTVLSRIDKKIDLDKMKKSMKDSSKVGIICKANVLMGFPDETHQEIWDSLKFCVQAAMTGIHDISIYPFSPYPGSKLFNQLRKTGKIPKIDDDYFCSLGLGMELSSDAPSFSSYVGTYALWLYRILGVMLFYSTSYLCRPWRAIQFPIHVFSDTQETLLETAVRQRLERALQQTGERV